MLGLILLLVLKSCSSNAVNGNWGAWGAWTTCAAICGVTSPLRRVRSCDSPSPTDGGSDCPGNEYEYSECSNPPCQVYGNWGVWGACSRTCGSGMLQRIRSCESPQCQGNEYDRTQCSKPTCPVHGNWGAWGAWSTCSATCGSGVLTRNRPCDSPAPAHGGSYCQGNNNEMTSCFTTLCPVNGNWGAWQDWNSCSVTCGSGSRSRYQECNNPEPAHGGSDCQGNDTEIDSCSIKLCPVNGHWGTWRDWNSCSLTCGSGSRSRRQECNNPEPAYGGSDCQGNDTEIESCSIELCPVASEEGNSSAAIGVGIGSTAVVVGLLIVFIYILKRYRLRKPAKSVIYDTAGDTRSSNSDLHIYDGLQQHTESPTHRQNDVIYVNTVI